MLVCWCSAFRVGFSIARVDVWWFCGLLGFCFRGGLVLGGSGVTCRVVVCGDYGLLVGWI